MFLENNYLSQPHKHSGARTEKDLLDIARRDWASDDPAHLQVRKMYEAQEQKQRQRYVDSNQEFEGAQRQGRVIQPKLEHEESTFEGEKERAELGRQQAEVFLRSYRKRGHGEEDDVEMGNAGAGAGAGASGGGFTSING